MKKNIFWGFMLSYFAFPFQIKAQWYGQISYSHTAVTLSSGKRTPNAGGYILGSFRPSRTSSTDPDFTVDKIDPGNAPVQLWEYQIQSDCGGAISSNYNCSGITVIETINGANGAAYALVGGSGSVLFFATLDASGNIVNQCRWDISCWLKPSIKESSINPGEFYICATDGNSSYAIKVDANATQLWGIMFDFHATTQARDIIESPYVTNLTGVPDEVIVVGRTDAPSDGTAANAFFTRLHTNNGSYVVTKVYSLPAFPFPCTQIDSDDWFSSIEVAQSPNNGQGFVLGGYSSNGDILVVA